MCLPEQDSKTCDWPVRVHSGLTACTAFGKQTERVSQGHAYQRGC